MTKIDELRLKLKAIERHLQWGELKKALLLFKEVVAQAQSSNLQMEEIKVVYSKIEEVIHARTKSLQGDKKIFLQGSGFSYVNFRCSPTDEKVYPLHSLSPNSFTLEVKDNVVKKDQNFKRGQRLYFGILRW
jgi:hypothetical protein